MLPPWHSGIALPWYDKPRLTGWKTEFSKKAEVASSILAGGFLLSIQSLTRGGIELKVQCPARAFPFLQFLQGGALRPVFTGPYLL